MQVWLRAHIWLTILTIPLVALHGGLRFGGPMTSLLLWLYLIVMASGFFGLALQHWLPRLMKDRLPGETVYEQIPHIRGQLLAAAEKMRKALTAEQSAEADKGAPAATPARAATAGTTPMAGSAAVVTPTARAKSASGSTVTGETVTGTASPGPAEEKKNTAGEGELAGRGVETPGTPTARVPEGNPVPPGDKPAPAPAVVAAAAEDSPPDSARETEEESETALLDLLEDHVIPYLEARRGDRRRLGTDRFSDDLFRVFKLRVTAAHRVRVEEMQAWCDERRMLDLQARLHHWLHGWLFLHVPFSILLVILTIWHAVVALFRY